jgi:hypothetical protein
MAGSRTWRSYNASVPAGAIYSVNVDESNARATYNGGVLMPAGAIGPYQKPRTLTMRYVLAQLLNNPLARRRFYVADIALWQSIASDSAALILAPYGADASDATGGSPISWLVTSASSERSSRRARATDTGLVDGTPVD